MTDIILTKKNETSINIDCDLGILYELKEKFTFFVEGYKFMPKFKAKIWDGKVSLLDLRFGTLPVGLTNDLIEYAEKLGYVVELKNSTQYGVPNEQNDVKVSDIENFVKSLKICKYNQGVITEITPHEHQIASIYNCIKNQRQISITPTGGGKSLIIYCLYRWYLEKKNIGTFMLVVPNLSLLRQMKSDFIEYSTLNGFDIEHNTQIIAEGESKEIKKSLCVCTWQSIYKQPSKWFNDNVDVILADETHQYKADAIKGIFEKATDVKYRFGVTGSLDKSLTNKLILKGMIGDISKVKSTRDLIEEGHLSELKITCPILKYNDDTKKLMETANYQAEMDFLCQHQKRNKFIRNLALSRSGNTLVLFNYVEKHGKPLYELIKTKSTNHEVHLVCGEVEADIREEIRKYVQATDNNIIVASVGVFSTGINLPRIHTIIFASPTKSVIRVMQSLGRGLRKSSDKDYLQVFDIADKIYNTKTETNYTMKHFLERLRIYTEEEHDYKIIELNIE